MTRKESILETAAQLFAERGYNATPTAEIARCAGVAEGTIFHHFRNKEGLLVQIFKDMFDVFLQGFSRAVESSATGLEAIENIIRCHFRLVEEKSGMILVMFRDHPFQCSDPNSPFHQVGGESAQRIIELFTQCLERGQRDGSIAPVPITETVHILRSLLYGLTRHKFLGPVELPDMTESVVAFCRRSLAPSKEHHE